MTTKNIVAGIVVLGGVALLSDYYSKKNKFKETQDIKDYPSKTMGTAGNAMIVGGLLALIIKIKS